MRLVQPMMKRAAGPEQKDVSMVVLLQVAAEYSVLASRNTPKGSFSDQVERIAQAVPTEYVAIGLGGLVMVYLVKKVLDAF